MKNQELYDEICRVLTWYEHPEEYPFSDLGDTKELVTEDLYATLVKVQNEMFC